ncbi:MAG: hypothetical protein M0P14_01420 [Alkaliphilus sp.]|nr:hypothetical protein [Alkaliphilus sp.]
MADEFDVSRQAVYDMLKRTERLLYQYEEKLNFIRLIDIKNKKISDILNSVISLENELASISSSEKLTKQIFYIKEELYKFLNN